MKARTSRLLLDLHLYLGLICAPYLVLYGVTGLAFNHEWKDTATTTEWSEPVDLSSHSSGKSTKTGNDVAAATRARDQLGLMGHLPRWRVKREAGELSFLVNRPGARYVIRVDGEGVAQVREERFGLLTVLRGLHGSPGFGGSLWALSWRAYTDLSLLTFAVALSTGTWLWWRRKSARRLGAIFLLAGTTTTVIAMIAIW